MCHSCKQFSPHVDWYHDPDTEPAQTEKHEEEDTADV
jgi:hypothetical protein